MRFGLALPHYDFSVPGDRPISFGALREAALFAERLGFDSVWVSDHFFLSLARYGGGAEPLGSLEPMTALASLAVATEHVRLGTLVDCAAFRHPGSLARMVSAIDLTSGGRFDLGLGAGWYEEEYEAFGYGFGSPDERFSLLEETLEVLSRLFEGGRVELEGPRFPLRGAMLNPQPRQHPRPPIWLGGKGGPRLLRLVARRADGWNTAWRWGADDYAERVAFARRMCEEAGRDPATLRLSIGLYTLVGEDEEDLDRRFARMGEWTPGGDIGAGSVVEYARDTLTGTPAALLDRVAEFAALGVEEIVISPASVPFALPDRSLVELFAETVLEPSRAI